MGDFEEYEREAPLNNVPEKILEPAADALLDLGKQIIGIGEYKAETNQESGQRFTSKGEIKDFQSPSAEKKEHNQKAAAEKALERARVTIVQQEEVIFHQQKKISASKETARVLEASLTPEQKKDLLHVSLDYDDEHISNPYHLVNLRTKLKEKAEKDKKTQERQTPVTVRRKATNAPGINLNKVAEGGSAQLSTTGGGGIG